MHKIFPQIAGNGILETLLFKISRGRMPPDPPRSSRALTNIDNAMVKLSTNMKLNLKKGLNFSVRTQTYGNC
jgi:hypothetical protein